MALQTIESTGSQITFYNVQELNRQKSAMGVILQKSARYFKDFWPTDHPPLNFLEYCIDTCTLTLYTEDKEIDHFVLPENLISHLETECREILCKLLRGSLL